MRSSPGLNNLWRYWQCCPSLGLFEFIDTLLILNFVDSRRTWIFLTGSSKLLTSNPSGKLSLSWDLSSSSTSPWYWTLWTQWEHFFFWVKCEFAEPMSFRETEVFCATDPLDPAPIRSKLGSNHDGARQTPSMDSKCSRLGWCLYNGPVWSTVRIRVIFNKEHK